MLSFKLLTSALSMQISAEKVVHIHYTLTNDEGEVIDSSEGHEPLAFIQGMGNIIPGLEKALHGKRAGDTLKVSIEPEEAYGIRDDELIESVPRSAFGGVSEIEPGMQFHAEAPDGSAQLVTVLEVIDDEVVLDGNHPMAGIRLHFDVEITDVRDATEEELDHGHVHGAGGHHH